MLRRETVQPVDSMVESVRPGCAWIFATIGSAMSWSYGIARAASTISRCSETPCSRARLAVVTPSAWTTMPSTPMTPTSSTTDGDHDFDDREAILATARGQPWSARAYHGPSYYRPARGKPEGLHARTQRTVGSTAALTATGRARRPARAVRRRNCWDYQRPPVLQPPLPAVAQVRLSVPVVLSRVIVNVLPDFEYAVIA